MRNSRKSSGDPIDRRGVLQISTATLLGMACPHEIALAAAVDSSGEPAAKRIGRPVRVVSLSFRDKPLQEIVARTEREGARVADLIVLPETWRGQKGDTAESLDGPTVTAMTALAIRHSMHIVCPIDRKDGGRRFNTAVLLDRQGRVACAYDKEAPGDRTRAGNTEIDSWDESRAR